MVMYQKITFKKKQVLQPAARPRLSGSGNEDL